MITMKDSESVSNRVQQLLFLFVFFFMCCCYNIKPALQCVFVMFRWMHVHPYETYTNYKIIMDDRVVVIIKL